MQSALSAPHQQPAPIIGAGYAHDSPAAGAAATGSEALFNDKQQTASAVASASAAAIAAAAAANPLLSAPRAELEVAARFSPQAPPLLTAAASTNGLMTSSAPSLQLQQQQQQQSQLQPQQLQQQQQQHVQSTMIVNGLQVRVNGVQPALHTAPSAAPGLSPAAAAAATIPTGSAPTVDSAAAAAAALRTISSQSNPTAGNPGIALGASFASTAAVQQQHHLAMQQQHQVQQQQQQQQYMSTQNSAGHTAYAMQGGVVGQQAQASYALHTQPFGVQSQAGSACNGTSSHMMQQQQQQHVTLMTAMSQAQQQQPQQLLQQQQGVAADGDNDGDDDVIMLSDNGAPVKEVLHTDLSQSPVAIMQYSTVSLISCCVINCHCQKQQITIQSKCRILFDSSNHCSKHIMMAVNTCLCMHRTLDAGHMESTACF
jgi:hypothetical protein